MNIILQYSTTQYVTYPSRGPSLASQLARVKLLKRLLLGFLGGQSAEAARHYSRYDEYYLVQLQGVTAQRKLYRSYKHTFLPAAARQGCTHRKHISGLSFHQHIHSTIIEHNKTKPFYRSRLVFSASAAALAGSSLSNKTKPVYEIKKSFTLFKKS